MTGRTGAGQSPALVLSRTRAIRSAAGFALDDPLADLREVFRVGDIGQGGGQTRGGAGVELAGRLTAEQAAFLGAALLSALLSAFLATLGDPVLRPLVHGLGQHGVHLLQLRERFGLRRPELRRHQRLFRPRAERPLQLVVGLTREQADQRPQMPAESTVRPMHDEHYKRLFAFPRMVEDLLRGFVREDWLDAVDFATLAKLSTAYVGDDRRSRHGDAVWRVRHRDAWLHVLILLEFQSRDDPDMALRILEYTTLLYRELRRNRALESDGRRPPVLPVVLYNGDSPWRAAVEVGDLITPVSPALARYQPAQRYVLLDERHVRSDDALAGNLMGAVVALEQSRDPQDLRRVVAALEQRAWDPQDEELSRVFAEWVWRLAQRLAPEETPPPAAYTLEEVRMTLEERVSQWPRQWRQDGLDQGLRQGLDQGTPAGAPAAACPVAPSGRVTVRRRRRRPPGRRA